MSEKARSQKPEAGSQSPEADAEHRVVTSDQFIDALMAAGLIPEDAKVREVTIYARHGDALEMDVVTYGDERFLRIAQEPCLRAVLGEPGA